MDLVQNDLINILSKNNFDTAWNKIKSKNSMHGIDNVTIDMFAKNYDSNIDELISEINADKYYPDPYQKIFIKKSIKGYRQIGILTLRDKLLQIVVTNYFSETIDGKFANTSYAYRIGRGHGRAIRRVKDFIDRKNNWVSSIDIDNFFDSINRKILMEMIEKEIKNKIILKIIEMWVEIGVIYKEKYINTKTGIAQGGVISPLLSNIYLNGLDNTLLNKRINNVRYADNIILLAKTENELIENLQFVKNYLNTQLKLQINKIDKEIVNISHGVTFCGIFFQNRKCIIDRDKYSKMEQKFVKIISNNNLDNIVAKLHDSIEGIRRYYLAYDTGEQIEALADLIINEIVKKSLLQKENISKNKLITVVKNIKFHTILPNKPQQYFINIINKYLGESEGKYYDETAKLKRKLEVKSRKFTKVWFQDLDLVVTTPFSSLGKTGENISIRQKGKIINQFSTNKIKSISVAAKGITISSDAIMLCSDKNLRINYFDNLGRPYASIIPTATPMLSSASFQIDSLKTDKVKIIIKSIIIAKIKNQISTLKYFHKSRKESLNNNLWNEEIERIENNLTSIKNLSNNLELDDFRAKILGYEGSSASAYWNLFAQLIPEKFNFDKREHQDAKNSVNIMLNYGYGILYTRILTAITLAGLNPNIGFLHKEFRNKPVLVYDLIENFRSTAVDKNVIAFIAKAGNLNFEKDSFPKEVKSKLSNKLLTKLNTEFYYRKELVSLNMLFVKQTNDLNKYLKDEIKIFKPFLSKW